MKRQWKKVFACILASIFVGSAMAGCCSTAAPAPSENAAAPSESETPPPNDADAQKSDPIKITMYYSDNATLPFKKDWLSVQEVQKIANVDLTVEAIPIADYDTKVSLALNTGNNAPDVILYKMTTGEIASLALNGAVVPICDYPEWTPSFNAKVEEFGMKADIDKLRLKDGKYYYLPALYDKQFYDGGLILREDFLEKNNLAVPKTFDDLYQILKKYKEQNPDSYPLTILAGPRVLYRMTMPSFGVSLGKNSASGSHTLSWDYEAKKFFPGAISDEFKVYAAFLAKLYAEGLLDPEMADPIDGDKWAQKMATGAAMATYAYYDQIGGVEGSSKIEGLKLQMYPPLEGPAGAHHQEKDRTRSGILFPVKTAKRPDFEQVVRTVDKMFFSDECADIWCLGVEGVTYTREGEKIVYSDDIRNSPDGIYKSMQVKYGCGSDPFQHVWINELEMTKYDENYARINKEVTAMDDAIRSIPPTPKFDDFQAEEAGLLRTPLVDAFDRWSNDFITGAKSVETDWDAYVQEMKNLQIEKYCELYNSNL